ncbi:MAG: hypothetical protein AAFY88_07610, partial [Acidobacteriota bacterium]
FDFGMVPQFMARFENTVLLSALGIDTLKSILLESFESPYVRSARYFEVLNIDLELEDLAASLIAEEAYRDARTGARALRPIFADLVNPFEFQPEHGGHLRTEADGRGKLVLTADMVRKLLR